jgi:hypothetical protein
MFALLIVGIIGVYASSSDGEAFKTSSCIRGCTEYKKINQKECNDNYQTTLKNCGADYKICLKQTRDLKNCLKTFNECKKNSTVIKKNCTNSFTGEFFNCKNICLNPHFKCSKEGESIPVILNPPECCEGLSLIPPRESDVIGINGICTAKCGNGICDITESSYNCQIDCNLSKKPTCYACGTICTTDPDKICPMAMDGSFLPVNFKCKIINGNCTKVLKNDNYCDKDSDCSTFFSNCGCNNYCKNKNFIPVIDCARACKIEDMNKSIDSCKCENNLCEGYKKDIV